MTAKMLGDANLGEIGNVDLFGLDDFGSPVGLNPAWGAAIVAGLSTSTSIAVRAFTSLPTRWSEGVGFAVGAVASAGMIAMEGTRNAGWAGLAAAFLSNGLRQLEVLLSSKPVVLGLPMVRNIPPGRDIRGVMVSPVRNFAGGLGVTIPTNVPQMYGAGVAGPQLGRQNGGPPVDLMQAGSLPASSQHVQMMGGRQMSGLGQHYGATLFGGGNR